MSTTIETWLPVVGYEGLYEVSDHGNVRSLDRVVPYTSRWGTISTKRVRGRPLAKTVDLGPQAYGRLQAKLCRENEPRTRLVHHLVLEAFVGPRPDGYEAAHGDGNAANNRVDNLRWVTPKQNSADKDRHGTQLRGEAGTGAKLSTSDVIRIRDLRNGGRTYQSIADDFGISIATAHRVTNGKRWGHVS